MASFNQRCLPLPRRRKRDETECSNGTSAVTIDSISDLEGMDGMAYLASVHRQASQLPDVFLPNDAAQQHM